MHDVKFRYIDNSLQEPTFMECCIAESGVGKGFLDPMIECLIEYLRKHDEESRRKLLEWQRIYKSKGQSKDKPDRPTDAAILVPETDMTNPALIQLLMDAEREGNRSLYSLIPEIDLLDQCCGGHRKVTKVIRLNFDTSHYGAQRATVEGITGNPFLRWRFNISCGPEKARSYFKSGIADGTVSRIGFSYIVKPAKKARTNNSKVKRKSDIVPRQGDYDAAYKKGIEVFLIRVRSACGEIKVSNIDDLIYRLAEDMNEIADFADNATFESWVNRSLIIAWLKGCVLYITEGYRLTKEITDFVEWSLYFDLWSKIAVLASLMNIKVTVSVDDVRKYGPANMLDQLPDAFSQAQLEQLRQSLGKSVYCKIQLDNWVNRGHVTFDPATELYHKTDEYLAKHR